MLLCTCCAPFPIPGRQPDRSGDLAILDTEFLLNDLGAVERRYEKIIESIGKGAKDKDLALKEKALFEKLKAWLEEEKPLRDLDLTHDEIQLTRGYGFLSLKPMLIVINCADEGAPPDVPYPHQHSAVVALRGRLEREIAELAPEDAPLFMEEYGITELAAAKSACRTITVAVVLHGGEERYAPGPFWRRDGADAAAPSHRSG
jgi:ribosome-binding ATPase YchF (GTP1/OBG family)